MSEWSGGFSVFTQNISASGSFASCSSSRAAEHLDSLDVSAHTVTLMCDSIRSRVCPDNKVPTFPLHYSITISQCICNAVLKRKVFSAVLEKFHLVLQLIQLQLCYHWQLAIIQMIRGEVAKEYLVNTSQLKSPYTHSRYNTEVKVFRSFKQLGSPVSEN